MAASIEETCASRYRAGRFCAAHALVVLLAWIVLAVGLTGLKAQFGGLPSNDQMLPGTHSQQASDLLAAYLPPQQNGSSPIVFHVSKGVPCGRRW